MKLKQLLIIFISTIFLQECNIKQKFSEEEYIEIEYYLKYSLKSDTKKLIDYKIHKKEAATSLTQIVIHNEASYIKNRLKNNLSKAQEILLLEDDKILKKKCGIQDGKKKDKYIIICSYIIQLIDEEDKGKIQVLILKISELLKALGAS